jgi:hypothetical protein
MNQVLSSSSHPFSDFGARRVISTRILSGEHIRALADDSVAAVVVSSFYPESDCRALSERILSHDRIEPYFHEEIRNGMHTQKYYGVDRIGLPFNSTYTHSDNSEQKQRYYSAVAPSAELLRVLSFPSVSPADLLKSELDRAVQFGAEGARFEQRAMLAGIVRITRSEHSIEAALQPHFDALPTRYKSFEAQLAANIYLHMSKEGGYLEIWDVEPLPPTTEVPIDWRRELPESLKIYPRVGELIIFNSRKPHAVGAFEGPPRISIQMFIGYNEGCALQLWN